MGLGHFVQENKALRLIIPDIPKSPNGKKGTIRMHWAARKRYNEYWRDLVRSSIDNSHKPCKVKMSVAVCQMRRRKLDPDNLHASVKALLDALKYWKLIKDDSEDWIELSCSQVIGKEKITIVEINPCQ
jgi:Holliday junction resolvase RusA-like endonuclease